MTKKFSFLLLCATFYSQLFAQNVAQTNLVAHFTNSRCGICSSRNPGFYTNLRQQANTLHIAFHPSSPYATCVFSVENPVENDAFTNYYGVYGGTPRLVINGNVIPASQNYAAAALFTPYQGLTSPFALTSTIEPKGLDSITAVVTITTRAAHSYTSLNLFLGLVQDTVFYAAPNGEQQHYDVFRQSFTGSAPLAFTPASIVGNSVTIRKNILKKATWTSSRLYTIAEVQTHSKLSLQAAASARLSAITATENTPQTAAFKVYPNPANDLLYFDDTKLSDIHSIFIINTLGQVLPINWTANNSFLNIAHLPQGAYFLRIETNTGNSYSASFIKQY